MVSSTPTVLGGLSDELVAEAVTSVASNLAPDVAEHLSPFTVANSPLPTAGEGAPEALSGLGLLASAPESAFDGGSDGDPDASLVEGFGIGDAGPASEPAFDSDPGDGLDVLDRGDPGEELPVDPFDEFSTDAGVDGDLVADELAVDAVDADQDPGFLDE